MNDYMINLACPTCSKVIEWSPTEPFRPFCTRRCKLIDLGEWAEEKKRIPITDSDKWSD
ncbi:MAG: DNA gyrase inhibitor YacG [Sodalis sp. (in: enterobacteria)]